MKKFLVEYKNPAQDNEILRAESMDMVKKFVGHGTYKQIVEVNENVTKATKS